MTLEPVYHPMGTILSETYLFPGLHQGFVISDFEGIDRITSPPHSNFTYSVEAGVSAGIDMVIYAKTFLNNV